MPLFTSRVEAARKGDDSDGDKSTGKELEEELSELSAREDRKKVDRAKSEAKAS